MKLTAEQRRKAAKKAARTRAANRASMRYYQEKTEPGKRQLQVLFNELLRRQKVSVAWRPGETGRRLKGGAEYGDLVGIRDAFYFVVLPDGYKRPQVFHPSFWTVLVP